MSEVLEFEAALQTVLQHAAEVHGGAYQEVDLLSARERVLAEAVLADRDQPPFDRATRDGFAVQAAGCNAGEWMHVAGSVRAGETWLGAPLSSGSAIEIMTGAPVPTGADAVVMVEHVDRNGERMRVQPRRRVRGGEHIVAAGSEARTGQQLLLPGTVIGPAEIALAASCGCASLRVFARPRIAIVATGDELVELDQMVQPQQIRNSNSYGLAAMVAAAGGAAARLPIAADAGKAIEKAIRAARSCDLLVLSGGVSMGKYDLVEEVLLSMGAEFFFTGVRMQPGKPVVFGRLPETDGFPALFFFGLPGNPVSTQVTFHCFVEPMVRALAGEEAHAPQFVLATLAEEVFAKPELTRLLPARMTESKVRLVGWQGSGDLAANARANCYALLPGRAEAFAAGEVIGVLLR